MLHAYFTKVFSMQQRIIRVLAYCYVFFLHCRKHMSKSLIWTAARIYVFLTQSGFRPPLKKAAAIMVLLLLLALSVLSLYTSPAATIEASAAAEDPNAWILDQKLIAHGLGQINGIPITNSKEALIQSYHAGFRVLEADLIMTTDGVLALRHDNWHFATLVDGTFDKIYSPMSLAEFRSQKPSDDLTTLTFEELIVIMEDYPDLRIITDTKEVSLENAMVQLDQIVEIVNRYDPALFQRITPQFFSEEMYQRIKENQYPFTSYIYTLYQSDDAPEDVVAFMKREGLTILTMAKERATGDFISLLDQNGIHSCAHTIYEQAELDSLANLGVDSFYTDYYLQ